MVEYNDITGKIVNPVVIALWIVNKRLVVNMNIIQVYTNNKDIKIYLLYSCFKLHFYEVL